MLISELEEKCKRIPEQDKNIEFYFKTPSGIVGPFNHVDFFYGSDPKRVLAWVKYKDANQ